MKKKSQKVKDVIRKPSAKEKAALKILFEKPAAERERPHRVSYVFCEPFADVVMLTPKQAAEIKARLGKLKAEAVIDRHFAVEDISGPVAYGDLIEAIKQLDEVWL